MKTKEEKYKELEEAINSGKLKLVNKEYLEWFLIYTKRLKERDENKRRIRFFN